MAHVGKDSLNSSTRSFLKQVAEELMNFQDHDKSGLETKILQSKRKRGMKSESEISDSESEVESRPKKSRHQSSSSSESEDEKNGRKGREESEEEEKSKSGSGDEEQSAKGSQKTANGNQGPSIESEDSTDDEVIRKTDSKKVQERIRLDGSQGEDCDQKSQESSDDSENEKKDGKTKDSDSESSSLPSLDDEKDNKKEKAVNAGTKKKKIGNKEEDKGAQNKKDANKSVVRLKRYISLCGVKKNYKKLFEDCRSVRAMVAILKKELEDLGVKGQPSIEKCKKVRMKREEAQELAELDVNNIIPTQGRPKRRSTWQKSHEPPPSAYQRSLDSNSDSDRENKSQKRRRPSDWVNLKGIISDDADSD